MCSGTFQRNRGIGFQATQKYGNERNHRCASPRTRVSGQVDPFNGAAGSGVCLGVERRILPATNGAAAGCQPAAQDRAQAPRRQLASGDVDLSAHNQHRRLCPGTVGRNSNIRPLVATRRLQAAPTVRERSPESGRTITMVFPANSGWAASRTAAAAPLETPLRMPSSQARYRAVSTSPASEEPNRRGRAFFTSRVPSRFDGFFVREATWSRAWSLKSGTLVLSTNPMEFLILGSRRQPQNG